MFIQSYRYTTFGNPSIVIICPWEVLIVRVGGVIPDIMSNLGLGMGGVGATTYQITLNGIRLAKL